ncbi:MAG TPA: transglycosylase SLT domain-containing protein [Polyangia bacterium]|jgi:soluble lytic murein transglycosylase|nr:transglycosylase SLT domain-containing protein [Polyangia bacterium]
MTVNSSCRVGAAVLFLGLFLGEPAQGVAAPPGFDPAHATPFFASGPAAEARRHLLQEEWAAAADGFAAYVRQHPEAGDASQAGFLAAYAASRAGRFDEAVRRFDALVKSYPLLGDYHRLYAARASLALKQFAAALERARAVPAESPLDGEARIARADALRQLDRGREAEQEYQSYLDRYPMSWREPEVRFRLAELQASGGKPAATTGGGKTAQTAKNDRWPLARQGYLQLYLRWPTESWGQVAGERLKARDPAALQLDGAAHLTRGLALFEAQRNPESEAELRAALESGTLDPQQSCLAAFHLAQSVFKARQRPRAAPLFDAAVATCEKAPQADPQVQDLHVKALYQGARCHAARGEATLAAALFERAEKEHPGHSYADDARLRQAEVYQEQAEKARAAARRGERWDGAAPEENEARAAALLGDLPGRYPSGDMRSEALFRLFFRNWRSWRAGRGAPGGAGAAPEAQTEDQGGAKPAAQADAKEKPLAEARRWLETALAKVPREEGWWDAGRTLYWLGRVAEREGRRDEALEHYRRCVREYPLAYYALAAFNRLREGWDKEAKALAQELYTPERKADLTWRFTPRELFGQPGFRRGVELARLGLGNEARREFAALGIRAPDRAAARALKDVSGEAEELLWLVAVLYDRAGEYAASHGIPRYALVDYALKWPTVENQKRWRLAYPRGYAELIVPNAQKNGQPAALEFAIVREESAFDPLTESFANAIGLTQLTAAPAKRFAQGLPYTREALRDPAINVAIGAREFGYLWNLFGGNAALAIAGYNAGEGAVKRWLREAPPGTTLDEFVESIPYDETRGYTKRVLASYFAYHWLYGEGDPVPSLGLELPTRRKESAPAAAEEAPPP